MTLQILALAGLAEEAIFFDLVIASAGLLLILLLTAVSLCVRSWKLGLIPLALLLGFTVLSTPWTAFQPVQSNDSDVHYWVSQYRILGVFWGLAVAGVVASLAAAWVNRHKKSDSRGKEAPNHGLQATSETAPRAVSQAPEP